MQLAVVLLILLGIMTFMFIYNCKSESFFIPQNIVTGGDFHIQPVGAIADQGSFTNDMRSYIDNNDDAF